MDSELTPIQKLKRIGQDFPNPPRDYLALGLTSEHLPELQQLACDLLDPNWPGVTEGEPLLYESDPGEYFARFHAWLARGQLNDPTVAAEALDYLAEPSSSDDDFFLEAAPWALAFLGAGVLPELEAFLHQPTEQPWGRCAAARAVTFLVRREPGQRERAVALLASALASPSCDSPELGGSLVAYLLDLKAVEVADTIKAAFDAGRVDEMVAGDWADVAYALGIGPKPPPRPNRWLERFGIRFDDPRFGPPRANNPRDRAKARRKAARNARKRSRR